MRFSLARSMVWQLRRLFRSTRMMHWTYPIIHLPNEAAMRTEVEAGEEAAAAVVVVAAGATIVLVPSMVAIPLMGKEMGSCIESVFWYIWLHVW